MTEATPTNPHLHIKRLPKLRLDWPVPCLWPNSRVHRIKANGPRQSSKSAAYYAAHAAGWRKIQDAPERVHFVLTFCPPTNGRFDLDNALAASKAAIDGLSSLLGVDDSLFSYTIQRGEKSKNGGVIVTAEVVNG